MERYSEAVSAFQKGLKLSPDNTALLVGLTRSYALLENTSEAHRLLQNLLDSSEERYLSPYQVATVYAALREKDKVFDWLGKAVEEKASYIVLSLVDPSLDP